MIDSILGFSPVMPYIVLLVGFALLIKGADLFVDGCSAVAKTFGIPTIIIGLTIVAIGTSAPEAAVSITSSIKGANDMSAGNVIGSNMFNLLMVVGVCAVIKPIKVSSDIIKRDFPLSLVVTIILILFSINIASFSFDASVINRVEGIILLVILVGYLAFLVINVLKNKQSSSDDNDSKTLSVPKSIVFIIIGAACIAFGGDFVVDSATEIARSFNISNTLIGLTVVALGTSLPELVTSIVAAGKGENDLAVGNVVGSNIFNILFVLGTAAAISPIDLGSIANPQFLIIDMLVLLFVSALFYIFLLIKKDINRIEGAVLVLIYAGYLVYIIKR